VTTTAVDLATRSGRVTGISAVGEPGKPLIVCIPGGSYNAHYFDLPGHSLIEAAHERGFPVVALDRPGYGGSDPVGGPTRFAANADVLDEAISELWKQYADSSPGVVLIGHSMGGAVAFHIASRAHDWPLLGVSATAIHVEAPDVVLEAWDAVPDGVVVEFTHEMRLMFMYGPEGTFEPDVLDLAMKASEPIPVEELREVVGGWITDFPGIAARVEVPVHYGLAEHENLWTSTPESVRSFGDAFTRSPRVDAEHVKGVGHNIDHHLDSAAFHQRQLDFADAVIP
jgi:pimeloyl-ACP methyl ester carboxylesterase